MVDWRRGLGAMNQKIYGLRAEYPALIEITEGFLGTWTDHKENPRLRGKFASNSLGGIICFLIIRPIFIP